MGHDFITNDDRHVHLRDMDIWTLRHFLCREASTVQAGDLGVDETTLRELRSYVEGWDWIGPGVVTGTDLSDFVRQVPQRRQAISELLRRTISRLQDVGPSIPFDYLEQHVNSPMAYFAAPQATERFVKAIRNLLELLD